MELFAVDFVNSNNTIHRNSVLRKNKVELFDSLYDPFGEKTDVQEFLDISESETTQLVSFKPKIGFSHKFHIANTIHIQRRFRYDFWTALGDIGGFHDGLDLIIKFFMVPIAAIFFENDILKGNLYFESLQPKQTYHRRKLF